ncbi:NUDIX domain-containing protein [Brevibacillus borstelensis]|uniref:NUDIX domain-containing protein n=1 Tax=Brevibacillus borstelensis TaxID=45462 RepID=UPI0030BB4D34
MNDIRMRVTVVVEHQGEILVIKEKCSGHPCYNLPGGVVDYLETIPDAARREVWEETGLLVEFDRMLWVDERIDGAGNGKHTIGIGVLAKLIGEDQTPIPGGLEDEEIEWAGWVPLEEFRSLPMFNPGRREQVIQALTETGYMPRYLGNMLS